VKKYLELQKSYNDLIYGENILEKDRERITQELALCAHNEISSLVSSTNYKKHHLDHEWPVDSSRVIDTKSKILFESIDVIRYIMAIMNVWGIDDSEFHSAFYKKDIYLKHRKRIDNNPWNGKKPVAIVDIDDVLGEFRLTFSRWLYRKFNIIADVNSKEYYFIDALKKTGKNPEGIFLKFVSEGGFNQLAPVENYLSFIDGLIKRGYWIHLLTARPDENVTCLHDTYQWLNTTGLYFDDISFASEKFRWCAQSKYYNSNSIKFAIDDSPKHIMDYTKHGIECFYPFKSYNDSASKMENAIGYYSFKDLLEIIDKRYSH